MLDLKSALASLHVGDNVANEFIPVLAPALALNDLDSDLRIAAFLSQAAYESRYFTVLEENLYYTTASVLADVFAVGRDPNLAPSLLRNPQKLANFAYANRGGNGDANSGDGWKYRGRGLFQLTFKNNYAKAANDLGLPLVDNPDLVAQPDGAVTTAIHYWMSNNLNALADKKDIAGITRAINGPSEEGLAQRLALYRNLIPN